MRRCPHHPNPEPGSAGTITTRPGLRMTAGCPAGSEGIPRNVAHPDVASTTPDLWRPPPLPTPPGSPGFRRAPAHTRVMVRLPTTLLDYPVMMSNPNERRTAANSNRHDQQDHVLR